MIDLIAAAGALILAATPAQGQVEIAAPADARSIWSVDARRAPLADIVEELRDAGVSVVGAPADASRPVSGAFTGELPVILARILRSEDFTLSQSADGYEIRFLSGLEGETGAIVAQSREASPVQTSTDASDPAADARAAWAGRTVGALLEERIAQAAQAGPPADQWTRRVPDPAAAPAGEDQTAPAAPPAASSAEQIAAMNARAAEQLSALVAALQASCPAGRSCD